MAVFAFVNVEAGVQVYELAPLTVNVLDAPLHIVNELAVKLMLGIAVTFKVTVAAVPFVQPSVFVATTL